VIHLSLRTRLTIWFAASIILILAPFLAGVLALQWRSMRNALDHHLREDAETAAEMIVDRSDGLQWRVDDPRDPGYDAGPQRWVEVYARDGSLLFVRGIARRDDIRRALPRPSPAGTGYRTVQTPAGAFVRMLSQEVRIGPLPVILRVARSEDELRTDLRTLAFVFGVGAPLAVLAASLSGYVISGRALRPLGRMAARARSISADQLSQRLPVESAADELGQLAVVFNETFARLEESFERLKRFTADASHQLRTPLTAIRSVGEVGLRESRTIEDHHEVIGSMLEEVDRLGRLVDTLLMLSRWESGRVALRPVPLDLGEVVRHVATQLAVLAEERGIDVDVGIATPLPIRADAEMLRAAVMNIVDNAIKFTPQRGRIRLAGSIVSLTCQLIVDDSGPGIPPAQRERVLERFHRAAPAAQAGVVHNGAGLGLAIADWVVRAHHGQLTIEDSDLGGARLVVTLPADRPESTRT
jgi:heavy metal sensor kinase